MFVQGDVFYKVSKSGDVFLGLPTKYIQHPEKEEVDRIDVEGSSFGNTMDFMCQCIELDDCGIHLTRQQLRDKKKSDPGLEKAELPVRTRKATKLPKNKSGKKNELLTEAGEGKPAAVLQNEEFYPGISQKISLETKREKMPQLLTYSSFAVLWSMDNSSPTFGARLSSSLEVVSHYTLFSL